MSLRKASSLALFIMTSLGSGCRNQLALVVGAWLTEPGYRVQPIQQGFGLLSMGRAQGQRIIGLAVCWPVRPLVETPPVHWWSESMGFAERA
ncbi:MAG: hypothetical protein EA413_08425 [Cyanobium sp. PLM2.Bin73]|jgi:hypothetical protein|nr:MAG: hypothetical protein EA413_08425 [Cyanobium sp. PLM2.Bin73]